MPNTAQLEFKVNLYLYNFYIVSSFDAERGEKGVRFYVVSLRKIFFRKNHGATHNTKL